MAGCRATISARCASRRARSTPCSAAISAASFWCASRSALFYALALSLSGLEFGLIVGILTGILAFIPYVGFAIGFVLAVGLALLQFGWGWGLIFVLLIFAVGQVLESSFLSPKLVGERVRLHPVWVIFALLAFGSLFGFLGVLIALPAAAVTGVLVRFALSRYKDSTLYRGPDAVVHPHRRKSDAAE